MSNYTQLRGTPFFVSGSGTTSASAVTAGTTVRYYVTDISGSSTGGTTGTWALFGGTTGTTILWQGGGTVNVTFSNPITNNVIGTVGFYMNGTALTYAGISGYFI